MKAFLSSTFKDLEPYRAAVIAQLGGLDGVTVLNMENLGARPETPKEISLRMARECDVFIGLVGHLYGCIPDGDGTSFSEQEYQAATEAGKDRLIFIAPETFGVPPMLVFNDSDPRKQVAFRARVLAEVTAHPSWNTPDELARGVMQAVYNWARKHGAAGKPLRVRPGVDEVAYASRCRMRWEAIDLSTLAMPGALDNNVDAPRLSQVFIPQDCRRSRPAVSLPRDYLEKQGLDPEEHERLLGELQARWEQQERLPSLDLLAQPDVRNVALLGDPGAGKSSLARFILLQLLNPTPAESGWRQALDGTWPVLVELRDLLAREAEGKCGDLIGYLAYVGETEGFGYDRAALEAQLRERPSLFIVDGLDEVFELNRRRMIVEEIVGLENRFPRMRVLVTSRIAGFNPQPFEAAGFAIATLDDLNSEQIEIFADRWFGLAFPGEPTKAERSTTDLLEAIRRRPQLAAIAGNPLILTIMAIIARHKRLARSRAQLYQQALDVLCYAWDYRRGLELPADSPLADLQPDDTLLMLRRIAWRMQESAEGLRANAIGEDELRAILVEFFQKDWHFPPPKAGRAGTEMVKLLQERNWVLTTRGPQLYGFVHRTFLEYLCALELAQRFAERALTMEELRDTYVLPRAEDDSYTEVIRLLCGRLPVQFADELIAAICPAAEEAVSQQGRLLLAWQALGELEPRGLVNASQACVAAISGIYRWLEKWDVASGLLNTRPFADAISTIEPGTWPPSTLENRPVFFNDSQFYTLLIPVYSALAKSIWLPVDGLRQKLFTLADTGEWHERRTAILIIQDPGASELRVSDLLHKRLEEDPHEGVRVAAIRRLTADFAHLPETFDLLRRRAAGDEAYTVRMAATGLLMRNFAHRPEILSFAMSQAELDDSELVRATALEGLTSELSGKGDLYDLLQRRAEFDNSWHVRRVAVRKLSEFYSGEAPLIDTLERWITPQFDEGLRAVAVAALIGELRNRDETFDRVKAWAEDESANVRATAAFALSEEYAHHSETLGVLQRIARGDPGEVARQAATLGWAKLVASHVEQRLLSRDLDGGAPGIDPQAIIDSARVELATAVLREQSDKIRAHYERLVREEGFPLRLKWLRSEE